MEHTELNLDLWISLFLISAILVKSDTFYTYNRLCSTLIASFLSAKVRTVRRASGSSVHAGSGSWVTAWFLQHVHENRYILC